MQIRFLLPVRLRGQMYCGGREVSKIDENLAAEPPVYLPGEGLLLKSRVDGKVHFVPRECLAPSPVELVEDEEVEQDEPSRDAATAPLRPAPRGKRSPRSAPPVQG